MKFSKEVNSDTEKYTFGIGSARFVRRAVVNKDICILENHYKSFIPNDMEYELKEDYRQEYIKKVLC